MVDNAGEEADNQGCILVRRLVSGRAVVQIHAIIFQFKLSLDYMKGNSKELVQLPGSVTPVHFILLILDVVHLHVLLPSKGKQQLQNLWDETIDLALE